MNANHYAKLLREKNGLVGARRIASRCVLATNPSEWSNLPTGNLFFNKTSEEENGRWQLRSKELKRLNNWWEHVENILAKMKD